MPIRYALLLKNGLLKKKPRFSWRKQIKLREGDLIIVDGYIILGNEGKMGLGGYLYEALEQKFPVIGIAKNEFGTPDLQRKMIFRGESEVPLFLTVKGAGTDEIKEKIEKMYGDFRIPALLKKLDQLTRIR